MRFSIVIPVYGTEKFLPRCLDSIVAQTDGDFEIVVVDDCSPGNCADVVRPYGGSVRYIRQERNRSAFQARRTGIVAARGDYIVPVDPDDYLMPETLARLRAVIERDAPDIISYWMEYDDGGKIAPHWCRHPATTVTGVEALRELVAHKFFTGVASKAFRRQAMLDALEKLDAPADAYVNTCDDFLMLVAVLTACVRVSFLDYAGYRYFLNEQSTSFTWKTRDGFRRAQAQVGLAGDLLKRMAGRPEASLEERALVADAVAGVEQWFAQMQRESSWTYRAARRLLRLFSAK